MPTTEIRSQNDMRQFMGEIETDWKNIRWEAFAQDQFRRMEAAKEKEFAEQRAPDGSPWAPNRPSTIRNKGHAIILVHHLVLKPAMTRPFAEAAIRMVVDEWPKVTMIFGNSLPYSVINDVGNPAKNLPARPHHGITLQQFDEMTRMAADFSLKALKR